MTMQHNVYKEYGRNPSKKNRVRAIIGAMAGVKIIDTRGHDTGVKKEKGYHFV